MNTKQLSLYRMPQEAIRYVRRNLKNWNLNENNDRFYRIFAGGLASSLANYYNDQLYRA
jgi:hypothetical protein